MTFVGLQKTRRDGQEGFTTTAGFNAYWSGVCRGSTEAEGQHGVGLVIKESILQDVEKSELAVEYNSARLMKVRLNLKEKSNISSFVVEYPPTDTSSH